MPNILTRTQAEVVYSVMCALNNVNGRAHARLDQGKENCVLHIAEYEDSSVSVYEGDAVGNPCGQVERHNNQAAFAAAYGLSEGLGQ